MEWAGRIIGAFYLVGGLVVLRQAWLNWRLEQMIVAIAPDARARLGERVMVWTDMEDLAYGQYDALRECIELFAVLYVIAYLYNVRTRMAERAPRA